ncbi:MAG: hypothetical protein R6V47_05985 [Candidatus Delongbacteria bacterium]
MVAEVKKKPILRHIITGVAVALCTLVVLAAVFPIPASHQLLAIRSDYAVMAQAEEIGEIVEQREQNSKTYYLGDGRYALDVTIGSQHYKDDSDNPDELWKDIDTTIVESPKANWDWEVVKGHWHLLIRADTTVAVGKSGNWLGFRYDGFGYLDWATKDYEMLQTRQAVTPTVESNRIVWDGIFGAGTRLEYVYTSDGFKTNIYIEQSARTWLVNNPPSSFGLDNQTSYLVGYAECDWQSSYPAEGAGGNPINWDGVNEFIESGVYWRDTIKDKLVTALPIGWAMHEDAALEEQVKVRYRFYQHTNAKHYLLFGARVLDLNAFSEGTIVIDPTLDLQVGANLGDVHEAESSGGIQDITSVYHMSKTTPARYWGAHRWTSASLPAQGDTIDVAYVELYVYSTLYDDPNINLHFEKAAAPAQFSTDDYDVTGRTRTTDSVSWVANSIGSGWKQSPSLVDPLQEVIDAYSPTALALICRPNTDASKRLYTYAYNQGSTYGAKLHIEYTGQPEISNTPSSYNFGTVSVGGDAATGLDYFTITNTGRYENDIDPFGHCNYRKRKRKY